MDKTVTLSDKEIMEIIYALSSRAENLLLIANKYAGESLEYDSELEIRRSLDETSQTYRRKGYYIHSLMSKFENL